MNEKRLVTVTVVAAFSLCGALSLGIIYRSKAKAAARAKDIVVLAKALDTNIAKSNEFVARCEFELATSALRDIESKITAMHDTGLEEQLKQAIRNIADAKRDYPRKLNQGYSIFEGQFISKGEKDRILARRQRQREEDERQKEEERRVAAEEAKHYAQSRVTFFNVEGGEVYLSVDAFTLHVPKGGVEYWLPYLHFFQVYYKEKGEVQSPIAGFFNIEGKPVKIVYASSDYAVASVQLRRDGTGALFAKNAGTARIRVSVGDAYVFVPLNIVELPVTVGMKDTEVIQIMGMPSDKTDAFCSWPESKTIDGIFYNPSASESIIAAQHWRFRKYPNAVLSIQDKVLKEVRTYSSAWQNESYEVFSNWVDRR